MLGLLTGLWLGRDVASFTVALDESGHPKEHPHMALGGYVFRNESIEPFEEEWDRMLARYQLGHFHMTDCANRKKGFAHLGAAECDLAAREAIGLIRRYAEYGIAVSVDSNARVALSKNGIFWEPYTFLSWLSLASSSQWAAAHAAKKMAYVFDRGNDRDTDLKKAFNQLFCLPEMREKYRAKEIDFKQMNNNPTIQAADILAWHWMTHIRRRKHGEGPRKDFEALTKGRDYWGRHFSAQEVQALGLPVWPTEPPELLHN